MRVAKVLAYKEAYYKTGAYSQEIRMKEGAGAQFQRVHYIGLRRQM